MQNFLDCDIIYSEGKFLYITGGGLNIDITNRNLWFLFEIGGEKVYITQSIFATWVVMAVLIAFAVFVRIKLKSFKQIPSGFQNMVETAVDAIANLTRTNLGEKFDYLGGYFFAVFAFILASNYSGLFGLRPPTSDIATTLALALTVFVLLHYFGIKMRKGQYFKDYLSPFFLFLPMNIIGEISRPISLSFRLFGNILGGLIILEIIYGLPVFVRFAMPAALHGWFDLFSGGLQAFVFTVLSITYISLQTADE
ncbi:MAG: F0F1 ATP synthase subunit A [Oscillospiraceae bacterium]|nr:F0F1 ATP synthase subunit A [Oscillospiraceae bacterium]